MFAQIQRCTKIVALETEPVKHSGTGSRSQQLAPNFTQTKEIGPFLAAPLGYINQSCLLLPCSTIPLESTFWRPPQLAV